MARKARQYERLPGSGRSSAAVINAARHSLWLGPDHLLSVRNQGYSEDYKRFYYADIEAVVANRSTLWTFSLWLVGLVLGAAWLLALVGWLLNWESVGIVLMAGIGTFLAIVFLANLLQGPTCATYIRTAVQFERLHSLNRLRTVEKALRRLRPRIDAVQEPLPPEEAADAYAEAELRAAEEPVPSRIPIPSTVRPRSIRGAPVLKRYRSSAHEILFTLLVADVVHSAVRFYAGGVFLLMLGLAVGIALMAALIAALVKQHGTDLSQGVKVVTWLTLAYVGVCYVFGMLHSTIYGLSHPETAGNAFEYGMAMANQPAQESAAQMIMLGFSIFGSGCLAMAGFLLLHRFRQERQRPPTLAVREDAPDS